MIFNNLHIYYRQTVHNKVNSNRPDWFDYEKCFYSLLIATNFDIADLTVCFDGTKEEYDNHFTKKYESDFPFRVKLINTAEFKGKAYEPNCGSSKSSCLVARIVEEDNLSEDSLIMLQENDYLFAPYDIATILLDLFNRLPDDNVYVSLYDHPDKYLFVQSEDVIRKNNLEPHWGMYRGMKNEVILGGYNHWRETPSICSSWIMSKNTFDRDFDLHKIGISDNTLCGDVSEKYNTKFYSPIPSIATHCQNPFVAPYINWRNI